MDSPFAFKPFCFMEAKRMGYDSILWVDSSGVVIRRIEPIFQIIEQDGYVFFKNSSHMLGEWCSDEALRSFGMSREEALKLPEANAAAIGLSMQNKMAIEFLDRWYAKAADGYTFRGTKGKLRDLDDYDAVQWNESGRVSNHPKVRGHRHDQSALGAIAAQLGMKLSDERIVTETSPFSGRTIIFLDKDVHAKAKPFNRSYFIRIFVIYPLVNYLKEKKRQFSIGIPLGLKQK
jgi:hypothetical protein